MSQELNSAFPLWLDFFSFPIVYLPDFPLFFYLLL